MALTTTEEAQVRQLIDQNAALLSLASNEPTIISKLAAAKISLADLTAASALNDADLFLLRQGTQEKSLTGTLLKSYAATVVPDATETVKGIVELATSAEAQAFTANKFIDGAKLADAFKGSNSSLSASGYQKLPSGLIIQWGTYASGATGTTIFPIGFPNLAASCVLAPTAGTDSDCITALTTTSFTRANAGTVTPNGYYIAVGY